MMEKTDTDQRLVLVFVDGASAIYDEGKRKLTLSADGHQEGLVNIHFIKLENLGMSKFELVGEKKPEGVGEFQFKVEDEFTMDLDPNDRSQVSIVAANYPEGEAIKVCYLDESHFLQPVMKRIA